MLLAAINIRSLVALLAALVVLALYWHTVDDISSARFKKPNDKLKWLLFVFCIPFLGMLFYYLNGRNAKIKQNNKIRNGIFQ